MKERAIFKSVMRPLSIDFLRERGINRFYKEAGCLYILYKKGKFHYAGIAKGNVMRKLILHKKDGHKGKWDSFSILTLNREYLQDIGALAYAISKPKPALQAEK